MSQVTTHILDTAIGRPAQGVSIVFEKLTTDGIWLKSGEGKTNSDGRIPDLLAPEIKLTPGTYRLIFDTGTYYKSLAVKGFYPSVTIAFEMSDDSHYHVPLLLNPFGYSTYRGS